MPLRRKLLTLGLLLLLVPLIAWLALRQVEQALRQAEARALTARAATAAATLPEHFGTDLDGGVSPHLLAASALGSDFRLDGYFDEWREAPPAYHVAAGDLRARLWINQTERNRLAWRLEVDDPMLVPASATVDPQADGVVISLWGSRGLLRFEAAAAGDGPLRLSSPGGAQLAGFWRATGTGYVLELAVPAPLMARGARLTVRDRRGDSRQTVHELALPAQQDWFHVLLPDSAINQWLASIAPPGGSAWLALGDGHILSRQRSDLPPPGGDRTTSPMERLLYRWVFEDMSPLPAISRWRLPPQLTSTDSSEDAAVAGEIQWYRDATGLPVAWAGIALPGDGRLLLQAPGEGLLQVTNRSWLWTIGGTLVILLLLLFGLYLFASGITRRVTRLSAAAETAAEDPREAVDLPHTGDQDELGSLARSHARLLQAVQGYAGYLESLAGRLSHELKTPLAITRSSLDNLSALSLDDEQQQYLQRAREGVERQTAILRALAEATRLESALGEGDFEAFDLARLLQAQLQALADLHPGRCIEYQGLDQALPVRGAPERIAQLFDKLLDNALSFAPADGWVRVVAGREGDEVVVDVINNGPPLPAGGQERIFDSLVSHRQTRRQSQSPATAPSAGPRHGDSPHLGLGLYVARLIAEAHHGSLSAADREEGVVFRLRMPREAAPDQPPKSAVQK